MHSVEQGGVGVCHHLEGEGTVEVKRSALRTAVGEDDVVVRGEMRNVLREGAHIAVDAVNRWRITA